MENILNHKYSVFIEDKKAISFLESKGLKSNILFSKETLTVGDKSIDVYSDNSTLNYLRE